MPSNQLLMSTHENVGYFLSRKYSHLGLKVGALQRIRAPKFIFQCVQCEHADMVMLASVCPSLMSAVDT